MPPAPLNTSRSHTWAGVVSGTGWKRDALVSDGATTVGHGRRTLTLWAKCDGELGKKAVQASGLVESVFKDQIDRLNTAQQFWAFRIYARGRGRIWRGDNKGKRVSTAKTLFRSALRRQKTYCLACLCASAHNARGGTHSLLTAIPRDIRRNLKSSGKVLTKKAIKDLKIRRILGYKDENYKNEKYGHHFIDLSFKDPNDEINEWIRDAPALSEGKTLSLAEYLSLFNLLGDKCRFQSVLKEIKNKSGKLTFLAVLKALQAAAHRAHLAQRVKPAPRRHRIQRPLYARPQPPSAPLAPPVI